VGAVGQQSPREVLPPDRRGAAPVSRADVRLEAVRRRRGRRGFIHRRTRVGQMKKTPFVQSKPAKEVDSELGFHIEQRVRANIAAGMSPDDARRAAEARFGDMDGVREECVDILTEDRKTQRRRDLLEDLRQDLSFAVRSAAKAPMFTGLAIVTLAL